MSQKKKFIPRKMSSQARLQASQRQHDRLIGKTKDAYLRSYHGLIFSLQAARGKIVPRQERKDVFDSVMAEKNIYIKRPHGAEDSFIWGPNGIQGSYTVDGFFEPD